MTLPLNQRTLRVISRGLHQAADFLNPDVTIYSDLNLYKEPLPLLCRQCCLTLITYQQWSITPGKNFHIHSRKPLQKHTVNPIPFYRSLKKRSLRLLFKYIGCFIYLCSSLKKWNCLPDIFFFRNSILKFKAL